MNAAISRQIHPLHRSAATALVNRALAAGTLLESKENGRSAQESFTHEAWQPPLSRCAEGANLHRGQGLRRTPPSAPHRSEVWQIQGPSDTYAKVGALRSALLWGASSLPNCRPFRHDQ